MRTSGKKATRPCPCGWLGHASDRCRCTPDQVLRYRSRISGPLLDRIDLSIEMPPIAPEALVTSSAPPTERSADVQARVVRVREAQVARQGKCNARLTAAEMPLCRATRKAETLLSQAMARLALSARAYHRVIKVARTIADLAGSEAVETEHMSESIAYRRGDLAPVARERRTTVAVS
jgi:magnesium chelatase family protein